VPWNNESVASPITTSYNSIHMNTTLLEPGEYTEKVDAPTEIYLVVWTERSTSLGRADSDNPLACPSSIKLDAKRCGSYFCGQTFALASPIGQCKIIFFLDFPICQRTLYSNADKWSAWGIDKDRFDGLAHFIKSQLFISLKSRWVRKVNQDKEGGRNTKGIYM
jgi:hypothetical protein